MPSGAKRRKAAAAAAAKEETPSGSGATGSFNGVDYLKGQGSNGGASQDLLESGGLTQSFTEEDGDGDSSPVLKIDTEKNVVVETVKEEEDQDSVKISRELKYDNGHDSRDLSVEAVKNAHGSSDSSSSSSSSDEETIYIDKTEVVLDPVKLEEVYEVVENDVDPQVPEFVTEEVVENAVVSQVPELVAEEVVENSVDSQFPEFVVEEVLENSLASPVADFLSEEVVENAVDSHVPDFVSEAVVENAVDSHVPDFVSEAVVENAASLTLPDFVAEVVENAVDSPVPDFVAEEVVCVSDAPQMEEHYEDLDKPGLSEANCEIKATTDDALPAHPLPIESYGESSKVVSFDVKDVDDIVLPPSDSPIVVTSNGVGHLKYPEIHYSDENEIPMAQAPLSVHRTSWKGCCGLFEVFAGSR